MNKSFEFLLQANPSPNAVVVITLMCESFWSYGFIFCLCECGQQVLDAFEEICDEIDRFNWYEFPIDIQKMLPIILIVSQEPVGMVAYGNIECKREIFKKVNT